MTKKINYIIREYPPEYTDFTYYFDGDGLTSAGGDYCYNLFIVAGSRNVSGFNEEEYQQIVKQADSIIDNFEDLDSGYSYYYTSYKEVMENNGIPYSSYRCHQLKEWVKDADTSKTEDVAEYLTLKTGKQWATDSARGYSQGDYVEIVYCTECYDSVKHYGEIWLGAAKEFSVIELDEGDEEIDACYGYIVADSQAWNDEDYKRLVCEWAGIPEDETRLELIDSYKTVTQYEYRTA